jgi:predicted nucleotidyltransferase component of viral defense system
MLNGKFNEQVQVLLKCLPAIRSQNIFALKGGTAINLFIQNLPRLSVDIDLTYVPTEDRETSIHKMQSGLREIASTIKEQNPHFIIKEQHSQQDHLLIKLLVYSNNVMVKIEPSFIMRGTLYPIVEASLCQRINTEFNMFLDKVPLLASSEIYAGKLCAALSRQHPRDLFDVKLLLKNGGITDEIRQAFVVYLACDTRPIHELLSPNLLDIHAVYQREFVQMTDSKITIDDLFTARNELIKHLHQSLTQEERQFLISIKQGVPNFELMPFKNLNQLPSLKWKLMNIQKMQKAKHQQMLDKLKTTLQL